MFLFKLETKRKDWELEFRLSNDRIQLIFTHNIIHKKTNPYGNSYDRTKFAFGAIKTGLLAQLELTLGAGSNGLATWDSTGSPATSPG